MLAEQIGEPLTLREGVPRRVLKTEGIAQVDPGQDLVEAI